MNLRSHGRLRSAAAATLVSGIAALAGAGVAIMDPFLLVAQPRPGLVAQKYAAMAEGPQPFLRGTAGLFYRDVGRYRGPQSAVAHGDGGEAVQLYGDPHLENIGAVVDDAGMLLDGVDFDASIAGPFAWDVRRAALGLRTALSLGAFDDAALDS